MARGPDRAEVVTLMPGYSGDPSQPSDAVIRLRGAFDTRAADAATPCQQDPDAWFPDRFDDRAGDGSDERNGDIAVQQVRRIEAQRVQREIRRTTSLCDSCYFKVNCAINALEAGDEYGIHAGVLVEPTPARLRKARARLADVIATEVIDSGRVPHRLAVLVQDRPDMEKLIAEAGGRALAERENARPGNRVSKSA